MGTLCQGGDGLRSWRGGSSGLGHWRAREVAVVWSLSTGHGGPCFVRSCPGPQLPPLDLGLWHLPLRQCGGGRGGNARCQPIGVRLLALPAPPEAHLSGGWPWLLSDPRPHPVAGEASKSPEAAWLVLEALGPFAGYDQPLLPSCAPAPNPSSFSCCAASGRPFRL